MLMLVIHFNQGTAHIGLKKGNMGNAWGGGFPVLVAPALYPVLGCAADILCFVCMLNDLIFTQFFL